MRTHLHLSREFFVKPGAIVVRSKVADAVAYLQPSKSRADKPGLVAFAGKSNKPVVYTYFNTEAERVRAVERFFASQEASAKYKAERRAKAKAFRHTLKVGDVLSNCWGYDQTNREYYEITKLIGATMCEIRELACQVEQSGFMTETVVPIPGRYCKPRFEGDDHGLPKRRRILEGNSIDIYGAHYGRASLYHRPEPGKLPIMAPQDVSHTH